MENKNPQKNKAGIHRPIICSKCGHKVGFVNVKSRLKWKVFWQQMAIAFILELVSNIIVYIIFLLHK